MSLNILYLDDEQDICELFVDLFAGEMVHIDAFIDDKDAIEAAKNTIYDLVFLDYRLPGTSGIEVARNLNPETPKILITGDIQVMTENEFVKIIKKPFNIDEIEILLKEFETAKKMRTNQM